MRFSAGSAIGWQPAPPGKPGRLPGAPAGTQFPMDQAEPLFTYIIIGLTIVSSAAGCRDPAWRDRLIFAPERILGRREGYRLVTSAFLHADWQHLALNLLSFYSFGTSLEVSYGPGLLLLLYFASIIGGSLLSLFLHRHHEYRAYGASGGVSGIIFAHIFLLPGGVGFPFFPLVVPGWLYAIFFLLLSDYALRRGRDNIGHDAHLGGAMAGLWVAGATHPELVGARPYLFVGVSGLALMLLFLLLRQPVILPGHWFSNLLPRRRRPRSAIEEMRQVNTILEKISRSGIHSLSAAEKRLLREASQKQNRPSRDPD